jgi:hypothetical protein
MDAFVNLIDSFHELYVDPKSHYTAYIYQNYFYKSEIKLQKIVKRIYIPKIILKCLGKSTQNKKL